MNTPSNSDTLWRSPLMWAAGITWLAVLLQSVNPTRLGALEPRSLAGSGRRAVRVGRVCSAG